MKHLRLVDGEEDRRYDEYVQRSLDAEAAGELAAKDGKRTCDCPFFSFEAEFPAWHKGWLRERARLLSKSNAAPAPSRDDVTDLGGFSPLKHPAAATNELLEIARRWDLFGAAALLLVIVWIAVSAVFSLS